MLSIINRKGFTLIEAVVAMGLILVVMIPIMAFFMFGLNSYHATEDQLEVKENVNTAINIIEQKAIQASYIVAIQEYNNQWVVTFKYNRDNNDNDWELVKQYDKLYVRLSTNENLGQLVAQNIEKIDITCSDDPSNTDCTTWKGINIAVHGSKNKAQLDMSSTVFLRNYSAE